MSLLLLLAAVSALVPTAAADPCSGTLVERAQCLANVDCQPDGSGGLQCSCPDSGGVCDVPCDYYEPQDTCVAPHCAAGGRTGVRVDGTNYCADTSGQLLGSCTGSDIGEVVLGLSACAHLCDPGYGIVLDGAPTCHTVGVCPSGSYGIAVDGSGCHTVAPCPAGKTGYSLDGGSLTCVADPHVPTVGLCPAGSYGVVVDGSPDCHTVSVCATGTYGVSLDGSACHTVEVCTGSTLGARVDGVGTCTASPLGTCPNGRKGVVVAGEELCPLP